MHPSATGPTIAPMLDTLEAYEIADPRPSSQILWRLLQFYLRGYHHIHPLSRCTLPRQGPAILVANHISALDPFILQSTCPRLITWMMAKEYYDIPLLNWAFKIIGAIPVQRSGRDLLATRAALRALEQGQLLGIFPEGRIALTPEIQPLQTGVALLALKTQVPIYPAYLDGTTRNTGMAEVFFYPQRGTVTFGPAIELDRPDTSRATIEAATNTIRAALATLQAQSREFMLSHAKRMG